MAEWWFNNSGQNLLTGIEGDATNPALLPLLTIAAFFDRIPEAVASYKRLRLGLLEEERARLDPLLRMTESINLDSEGQADRIQSNWNKAGIHTAGRYGGTRRGGNK